MTDNVVVKVTMEEPSLHGMKYLIEYPKEYINEYSIKTFIVVTVSSTRSGICLIFRALNLAPIDLKLFSNGRKL